MAPKKSCILCKEINCDGKILHTFADGTRQVDFVLVYSKNNLAEKHRQKREMFCQNLENEGLELEHDASHPIMIFIKVHVPQSILINYLELLRYKMPIRGKYWMDEEARSEVSFGTKLRRVLTKPFRLVSLSTKLNPGTQYRVHHEFSRDKEYLFDMDDPNFFTNAIRISICSFILDRTRFTGILDVSNLSKNVVGIQKLLDDKVFDSAYPLHDGNSSEPNSKRRLLLDEWASISHWMRPQPLDEIKDYFGPQVALYFAWLGFYSKMLIGPAIIGTIAVLFGLATMFSNRISQEICSSDNQMLMCPSCDEQCDYWQLKETCVYSRLSNLFDNQLTVVFAVLVSLWATLFLELWKRYSSVLVHNWGLSTYTRRGDHPRPQYLTKLNNVKTTRVNVETLMKEPFLPYWRSRFPRYCFSTVSIIFLVLLSLCAMGSLIIFRMATIQAQHYYEKRHSMTYKSLIIPTTAAIMDLCVVTMLNYGYKFLAEKLTDLELRRTQVEYDESLALKNYLFKFVNYYAPVFYVAFVKGKLVGYPAKYNRILGLRQDECNPGGCLMELFIELAVIMVGRQLIRLGMQRFVPFVRKTYNRLKFKMQDTKTRFIIPQNNVTHSQWEEDYPLLPWESQIVHGEHLEKVIQFGFITLFVVAFPIAPLLALLNNFYEMRSGARKLLLHFRRPVPKRVRDIGYWTTIMEIVCRLSVLTNALIIAFSTTFIPEFVYAIHRRLGTDESYLSFTHSVFDIRDFAEDTEPIETDFKNVTMCFYEGFRNPPTALMKYKKSMIYWQVLAARVIFVLLYQNIVAAFHLALEKLIPDVPRKVMDRKRRGENLVNRIVLNQGERHDSMEMVDLGTST